MVKINFDGAIFSNRNIASLGIIICNDYGLVMATLSQQIPLPTSVEMVEVLAARRALLFARELGFESLVVEGDLEIIIKAINGGGTMLLSVSLDTCCMTFILLFLHFSPFLSSMLDA